MSAVSVPATKPSTTLQRHLIDIELVNVPFMQYAKQAPTLTGPTRCPLECLDPCYFQRH